MKSLKDDSDLIGSNAGNKRSESLWSNSTSFEIEGVAGGEIGGLNIDFKVSSNFAARIRRLSEIFQNDKLSFMDEAEKKTGFIPGFRGKVKIFKPNFNVMDHIITTLTELVNSIDPVIEELIKLKNTKDKDKAQKLIKSFLEFKREFTIILRNMHEFKNKGEIENSDFQIQTKKEVKELLKLNFLN